ncbi:MAG: RNA 2'-phosphotransferase [Veillonella sp.]|nr:RNA 2'-phosphotransferase [Veillonella sp.]
MNDKAIRNATNAPIHTKDIQLNTNINPSELTRISKFISMVLRHKPHVIGLNLDEHGWADVVELLEKMKHKHLITMDILEKIVRTDNKQRYSFNEDHTKIRANQGHSINVDVELIETVPPEILYHGTGEKSVVHIDREGLKPMNRLYVHLSGDLETAERVGKRHGNVVIYKVRTGAMHQDGFVFYKSVNGVWLTKNVPVQYLEKLDTLDRPYNV